MKHLDLYPDTINEYVGRCEETGEEMIIRHYTTTNRLVIEYHEFRPEIYVFENVNFDEFLKVFDMLDYEEFGEGLRSGFIGRQIER